MIITSKHYSEYNLQRTHSEYILHAEWHITINEWMQFYLDSGKLRDHPPVTTTCWMRRIDPHKPFEIGNVRCSTVHETGSPPSEIHRRSAKTKTYKLWRRYGQYT